MRFKKPKDQPKKKRPAFKVFPDGREVCSDTKAGKEEYKDRIRKMWERQKGVCSLQIAPICQLFYGIIPLSMATFEHQDGRGMNGGHRDDRIQKDGKPYNSAACSLCNGTKGSKRIIIDEIVP